MVILYVRVTREVSLVYIVFRSNAGGSEIQNLHTHFWIIANSALKRATSSIPPLFNNLEVQTSSASDKTKLFG